MSSSDSPCLSLVIARLNTSEANHFATWVVQSPYPSGYVHHDSLWPESLSQAWQAWLEMFSPQSLAQIKPLSSPQSVIPPVSATDSSQKLSYSSRLMQHLGIQLWQWLFQSTIKTSLDRSQGIAIGQAQPLRVRLDIREPDLIPLPWEIMQPQAGQPAISLSQQLLFSRTTSDVNPLPQSEPAQLLNILLVLGQPAAENKNGLAAQPRQKPQQVQHLQLEQEAQQLSQVFTEGGSLSVDSFPDANVPCQVTTLIQPTVSQLITQLETGEYNVLFYGGHCIPAPDGGLLFLQPDVTLNGTELAQVLVRCGVVMAVFNACWGAHPAFNLTPTPESTVFQAIPSSSLAKVLIHHGVPAVLGMRDSITDQEALSFIQAFAQALVARKPIDQAVAIARQHLLTLYKFNQPAWTLPVLYMHPEFSGELIQPLEEIRTELPANSQTWFEYIAPKAWLRLSSSLSSEPESPQLWAINAGSVRVGRAEDNDIVIGEQWVSSKHAEIFCRNGNDDNTQPTFFLRDFSRYGTLVLMDGEWQRVHHQEIALIPGIQLKFGSSQGQTLEFLIESAQP